ncbi:hypothetical protein HPB50_014713 [Hyalomma asiaticum]|uniref:Uncharacterized protein n=1 Tax=Hyalomma asiaticum TaxID=266040 RepID=A0ACB7RPJ4_HYAAI|nr:hypothetical protein HPB50_014713 [Hyalomma asiaticum]
MPDTESYDVLYIEEWKRQLDIYRPCTGGSPREACWLRGNLAEFNRMMHPLALELEESRPGALHLRSMHTAQVNTDPSRIARDASFLASWLLCNHTCIQDLSVSCMIRAPEEQGPFPVRLLRPSSTTSCRRLRALKIFECSTAHLVLADIDAIVGVETLYVDIARPNEYAAAKIDALLQRNHSTLRKVAINDHGENSRARRSVESLVACEYLTLRSLRGESGLLEISSVTRLMSFSSTLKELIAFPIAQGDVPIIASALETNRTLTKLSLHVEKCSSIEKLFEAFEMNRTLKDLFVLGIADTSTTFMQAVASALKNNSTLKSLYMLVRRGRLQRTEALWQFPVIEASALCKALRVNKSLKKLKLMSLSGSEEERVSLARQLLADKCYDRVHLGCWTEASLRVLSPVLVSSERSPEQLWLPDLCQLSHDIVSAIFSVLASNKRVNHLEVSVKHEPDARVALLCDALKRSRFIEFLRIHIMNGNSANEILRALAVNKSITEVNMSLQVPAAQETMTALSDMLLLNKSITVIVAWLPADGNRRFMDSVVQGMLGNRKIISFTCCSQLYVPPDLLESLRRNMSTLNTAVEFVLKHRGDRHSAECFELFKGNACLRTHLREVTWMSDAEARVRVASADRYLRESYLVITGVVRRSVACWPADVTQLDDLNSDCWRAIARYLSITDVCVQQK